MLPTVDELLSQVEPDYREQFSPSRYPYTYAADFLRGNPQIVPQQYRPDGDAYVSRADASRIQKAWALGEQLDGSDDPHTPHHRLAEVLADAYLRVHGIDKP